MLFRSDDTDASIGLETTWYEDDDGDGYGNGSSALSACEAPSGFVADGSDCVDSEASIHPGASEVCDGVDNDCDGAIDPDTSVDAPTWYADTDGDGTGDAASSTVSCSAPSGFVADSSDCDDGDATVFVGADEYCDGIDNDCDGSIDESGAVDGTTVYADTDGDGYGDASNSSVECSLPSGYVSDSSDCDDTDSAVNPAGDEVCDGVDNDCDGDVDDADA